MLLAARGSGIAPLMAIIRTRRALGSRAPFRLIYSVRSPDERYYAAELRSLKQVADRLDITYLYTRTAPDGWQRRPGRIVPEDIAAHGWPPDFEPSCFVCGPTGFVEAVADILTTLGHDPGRIKTERFGPTGG